MDEIVTETVPPAPAPSTQQSLLIPIAIVVAGIIVGGSIYFVERGRPAPAVANTTSAPVIAKNIPAVSATDHVYGDVSAPVKIVEYTDIECPFCKDFTPTMKQVVQAYPGKVAWVIRNFPIQQLHPNAPRLALAAECVAGLGGNDAYWKFLDSILAQSPVNTFFDMTKLTSTAQGVGVDGKTFDSCVATGKYQEKITEEFNNAVAAGGQGTPFSVLITKNGDQIVIAGDQPYEKVKAAIDAALKS